jgi:hypothetical protein
MNRLLPCLLGAGRWIVRGVMLLVMVGQSACHSLPSVPAEQWRLRIEIASLEKATTAGESLRITSSIKNDSAQPVYLLPCAGTALFRLERRAGTEWEGVYHPSCDYALRPAVMMEPGATRIDVASIPVDLVLPAGTYRVVYAVYRRDITKLEALVTATEHLLPEAQRTSVSFEVDAR